MDRHLRFVVLLFPCAADPVQFTTQTLRTAVSLWCSDEVAAEATYGHISEWDTSQVTDMSKLFKVPARNGGYCSTGATFNGDISCWDTGRVTNMFEMLTGCAEFNQPIIAWDVSQVTNLGGMFYGNLVFNQPLAWDVGQVSDLEGTFEEAVSFNQEILSSWDISSVTTTDSLFFEASAFAESLCWNTAGIDTAYMFTNSGGGIANPFMVKCACSTPGTYYDGQTCSDCPLGQFSKGKTSSCFSCPEGMLPTHDRTSCYCVPDPTPQPTSPPTTSPRPTPEPSPMPTVQDQSRSPTPMPSIHRSVCFHGDGQVTLEWGEVRSLAEIRVGDSILTADDRGNFSYSPVLSLPHKKNSELVEFLELLTETGKRLNLTPDHLLPRCSGEVVTARSMVAGDCILTTEGRETLETVTSVHKAGVYTAITANTFIVVDDVVASSFGQDRDTEREYQRESRRLDRQRDRKSLRREGK